ncbi:LysE family translocator [Acetobacteraceae bacterium]|nr:LysE family translocator [Acetobacteraceae bacterium]
MLQVLIAIGWMWGIGVIVPGMDFVLISRISFLHGRRAAILATFGDAAAIALWSFAAFIGIQTLFEHAPKLYHLLQIIGSLYLIYLGLQLIWQSFKPIEMEKASKEAEDHKNRGFFLTGFFVTLANPAAIFWLAAIFAANLPVHTPWEWGIPIIAMIGTMEIVWYSLVACLFGHPLVSEKFNRWRRWVDVVSGLVFMGLAVQIALESLLQ